MWWKRTVWHWRAGLAGWSEKDFVKKLFLGCIFAVILFGCVHKWQTATRFEKSVSDKKAESQERSRTSESSVFIVNPAKRYIEEAMEENVEKAAEENNEGAAEEITALYQKIYGEAMNTNVSVSIEAMQEMISGLGEHGITAVDEKNQVNMTGAERVLDFCKAVDEGEAAELTIVVAAYDGGFIRYDLKTENGNADIVKETYQYENEHLKSVNRESFQAVFWQYTAEGYLLFGGNLYSEDYYVLELAVIEECAALRVEPLDEARRELNRKYILPIGYGQNNLFLTDWSEEDYGKLDFYDMFDHLYPIVREKPLPYEPDENLNIEAVYHIPEGEFEAVIQEYFQIDKEQLRERTVYLTEDQTYAYKPRGFYESEYPDIPYPEVVSYEENSDKTITLTVNAVYPEDFTSKAFTHKVVVRPLPEGGFCYVSNQMLPSEEDYENWWHAERAEY